MPEDKLPPNNDDSSFDEFLKRLSQESAEDDLTDIKSPSAQPESKADSAIDSLRDLIREEKPALENEDQSEDTDFESFLRNLQSKNSEGSSDESDQLDARLNSFKSDIDQEKAPETSDSKISSSEPDMLGTLVKDYTQNEIDSTSNSEKQKNFSDGPFLGGVNSALMSEPTMESIFGSHDSEDDSEPWEKAESRLSDLQQNFKVEISEKELTPIKPRFMEILNSDEGSSNPVVRQIYLLLGLVIVALLGLIVFFLINPINNSENPRIPLSEPISTPYPIGLVMFTKTTNLEIGQAVDSVWTPIAAEWLLDTEICRVISLPVEQAPTDMSAVALVGTGIQLNISNGDTIPYVIKEVKTLTWEKFTDYAKSAVPSIVIGYKSETLDEVLVLYAEPIK